MHTDLALAAFFGIAPAAWTVGAVALSVVLLTVMIAWGRVQPFLAFVIVAMLAAVLLGQPLDTIPKAIETGIGDLLGSLAVIICLGAVFGKLIADSGAAQKIATTLINISGQRRMPLALTLTGFIVGIPLYYNVGFVLMVPLIFSLVFQSGRPAVALAIPLLAGLSIAHGFLPPHPSPTALVAAFHGDLGTTLLYGLFVAIPTLLIAGPLFAMSLKKIHSEPLAIFRTESRTDAELPGAVNSFVTALLPVMLLAGATVLTTRPIANPALMRAITFVANPMVVMLVAYSAAIVSLGLMRGRSMATLMKGAEQGLRDIAPILLIIAGAGALKQVFVMSGVSDLLGSKLGALPISPLVLGWLIATVIRICLGSATVAGLTAAGIVAPLVLSSGVNPNLMALAVGAGSLMCSHVNDSAFWMFKEYFNLSLKDTFRSWTMMETLAGIFGLLLTLLLERLL